MHDILVLFQEFHKTMFQFLIQYGQLVMSISNGNRLFVTVMCVLIFRKDTIHLQIGTIG